MQRTIRIGLVGMIAALIAGSVAEAQTDTSFTYQGSLHAQEQPYSGSADYRFSLWDAAIGGVQIGDAHPAAGVAVEEGLFTTAIDFGAEAHGPGRWLQVEVRTPAWDGNGEEPPFFTFPDRTPLTAAPYALRTRGIFVNEAGDRVGVGTQTPDTPLHVEGGTDVTPTGGGYLQLGRSSGPNLALDNNEIVARANGQLATMFLNHEGGDVILSGEGFGSVGIGTSTPQARLHVDGTARADRVLGVHWSDVAWGSGNFLGNRPIHIQKYGPFENGGTLSTGIPTSGWVACVVGFRAFDGDINENGTGDPIVIFPWDNNGIWHITFDVHSHFDHESWEVWVMYIDRRLVTTSNL